MNSSHAFFKDSPLVVAKSPEDVAQAQQQVGFRGQVLSRPGTPFALEVNSCHFGGLTFYYTRQQGPLLRTADNHGAELVVGVVCEGEVDVFTVQDTYRVRPGGVVLSLPGDLVVQRAESFSGLTVRAPVSGSHLFRLRAAPDKVLKALPRLVEPREVLNVCNLVRFVALERDRVMDGEGSDQTSYLKCLAETVSRVVISYVSQRLALPPNIHNDWYPACSRVDELVRRCPCERFTTSQLADAALVSIRQLYRDFEDGVGTSPRDYAHRIRLQFARQQVVAIESSSEQIREIGVVRSFSSYSSFVRDYVDEYGERPEETLESRKRLLDDVKRRFWA